MISLDVLNKTERKDEAQYKRVELHCHTNMSALEGIATVEEYIDKAVAWGMDAIAITDENCIQAFPGAYRAIDKLPNPPKLILGTDLELYLGRKKCRITVLAKNELGRTSLYKVITEAHRERHYYIDYEWLKNNKNGLLIGFSRLEDFYGCEEKKLGELTQDEICLFDFFEVFPESAFFDIENKKYESMKVFL